MKRYFFSIPGLFFAVLLLPRLAISAESLAAKLSGRILLQVEEKGEAWYVYPESLKRYYLGRPDDALQIMKESGLGITNSDLERISKENEIVKNYNFSQSLSGRILLQVEENGEAWYVSPVNLRRYFLGRPQDAFNIMQSFGLGINNGNIETIPVYITDNLALDAEKEIHYLINNERINQGLKSLTWNNDFARVARMHSEDLAKENEAFTGIGMSCDYPLIHHEGLSSGLYHSDRLNNQNIYYFSQTAENIALVPRLSVLVEYESEEAAEEGAEECQEARESFRDFIEAVDQENEDNSKIDLINNEIKARSQVFSQEHELTVVEEMWVSQSDLSARVVAGWMESVGHRRNILNGDYTEEGIGVAYINEYLIATQIFIKRAECGYKNGACCKKAGYYSYCFSSLQCASSVCN